MTDEISIAAEDGPRHDVELTIITGLSGAGKSHAMAAFEDAGFFCIDNLPPQMIPAAAELFSHQGSKVEKAAVVSDVRGGKYFEEIERCLNELDGKDIRYRLLYLEASDEVLLRRFKETRRPHPLAPEGDILEGIRREREMLAGLKKRAQWVVDTSEMNVHELRASIVENIVPTGAMGMILTMVSFGYKYGTPLDADLLLDVRFLPNPNYVPELNPLTGLDAAVRDYVIGAQACKNFFDRLTPLMDYLLPMYIAEGKSSLTVGIGCTGGHHRSVAIAEWLARNYRDADYNVILRHRDIGKE
ncbi:MAG: RNase adapter RapZ [Thermoleophilia bacterium]|jgi:UPF0042 nucleotide-binding protein